MRAFDRDLIRGGHYGQRPVCSANRPNTWPHRPACKREENPCQLGAVHTWHIATDHILIGDGRFRSEADMHDGVLRPPPMWMTRSDRCALQRVDADEEQFRVSVTLVQPRMQFPGAKYRPSCWSGHSGMVSSRSFSFAAVFLAASTICARAVDEIQVYNAEIAKIGQWTFQLHSNYAFIGRKEPDFPGGLVPNHALQGTGEWAYGITDWWEMGFYTPYAVDQNLTPYSNAAKI